MSLDRVPETQLQSLREDLVDWVDASFGDDPKAALLISDVLDFVVSSTRRYFGEEGVGRITKQEVE